MRLFGSFFFFFLWGGGGGGGGFEIMQMALSYYLNKLRKDCFLKHHGRIGLESAARACGAICRTFKGVPISMVQMIQSVKRE